MTDNTLLATLVGAACALGGIGITFLVLGALHRKQLNTFAARLDKIERARQQTNGMLVQAKKQIEGLQKDLEDARRVRREVRRAEGAEVVALTPAQKAEQEAKRKAQELADAKAKLDLLLDSPEAVMNQGFLDSGLARGFAETRPMTGFGPADAAPPPRQAA